MLDRLRGNQELPGTALKKSDWRRRYVRLVAVVDAGSVLWAMSGALILRFGVGNSPEWISENGQPYVFVTLLLSAVWWIMLGLSGTRDVTILGYGTEEYKRVLGATFWLFGLVATVSYVFGLETARGYIALALPSGLISLFVARMLVRQHLHSRRVLGDCTSSVLLIGGIHSVEHLARALHSQPTAGYVPVATYLPGTHPGASVRLDSALPNLGHETTAGPIVESIIRARPDVVALASGVGLSPRVIRELGWVLADMNVKMIMAPALTDVAGPRIHTQPLAGLPLVHVSTPNLGSGQRLLKRAFDLAGSLLLILLLSPVLAAVALIVKIDSPGPVLFTQDRVGVRGRTFRMFKFRSMVEDAEDQLQDLKSRSEGNGVLFKLKEDPRITRSGHVLRRYSLDELPQLFNVVNGTMSLVGPRPPLASEVEQYQAHVHRRLLVRPGLTGLWQVSGRSLLSWDESVRLDLYYVDNWSLLGDITILLKTVRAVLGRHGAY